MEHLSFITCNSGKVAVIQMSMNQKKDKIMVYSMKSALLLSITSNEIGLRGHAARSHA